MAILNRRDNGTILIGLILAIAFLLASSSTSAEICDACQEAILLELRNQTEALVNISVVLSDQTEIIVPEFNLTRTFIGQAIANQTLVFVDIAIDQTNRIVWAMENQTKVLTDSLSSMSQSIVGVIEVETRNQTEVIVSSNQNQTNVLVEVINNQTSVVINQSSQQISILDELARLLKLGNQKLSSMIEYDMRGDAHYRLIAVADECDFENKPLVIEKFTVGRVYIPRNEMDSGWYCFVVMEYDPDSGSYGLPSESKLIYVNNTAL